MVPALHGQGSFGPGRVRPAAGRRQQLPLAPHPNEDRTNVRNRRARRPPPPPPPAMRHPVAGMRERFAVSPRTYFLISAAALVALTLIVLTGAAVRVTGSGLGCPSWPQCYDNGRLVAETDSHALIEFGNRTFTSIVAF